jgi:hypothetical protein
MVGFVAIKISLQVQPALGNGNCTSRAGAKPY